jgi:hypothetical protein
VTTAAAAGIFGGVYFVVVTAAEMMGFGTSARGLEAPRTARKLGEALTAREGIAAEHGLLTGDGVAAGNGVSRPRRPRAS